MRVCDLSVGMLLYFTGEEHVYAVLLDQQGRVQHFTLCRCADLVPVVDRVVDVLESPYAWSPAERARVLREFAEQSGPRLLPPAAALSSFDIITIVPHHFLHGVPFHVIKSGGQPLGTRHGIAYCSSGTLLSRCVERNRARQFDTAAWQFPVPGDPAVPSGPVVKSCLSYGVDVLTEKNAAYRELAQTFAQPFPEHSAVDSRSNIKIALNFATRTAAIADALRRPDAICLTCHGYYDTKHSHRSGLLLNGRQGVLDMRNITVHGDTVLRIQDHPFAEVPLRLSPNPARNEFGLIGDAEMLSTAELEVHCQTEAQLVALFGCFTGTGVLNANDDYASHAYQWLKVGAASAVASLWEADFPTLTDWSHRFATHWVRDRQPKAIAAREATRAQLVNNPGLVDEPALWGSVALLGDWL